MLRELVNEIVELLNESDVKDTQINELRAEVEGLKVQTAQLKQELEIANNSIVELNNEVISLNNIIIENKTNGLIVLIADEGKKITNTNRSFFSDFIYLSKNDYAYNYVK